MSGAAGVPRSTDKIEMTDKAPGTVEAAFGGLCPRCSEKTLFAGIANFAPECRKRGLDYRQFNVGDGPAAFLILIIGALVTIAAIALQLSVEPPFWVHIILWIPIASAAVLGSLRFAKAGLIQLEYRNRAREGRLIE